MKAYDYDSTTKEFLGIIFANFDPEEQKYTLPAHSTFVEPPEFEQYQNCIFDEQEGEWVVVEDYRGLYQTDLKTVFEEIIQLGPIKDNCAIATVEEMSIIVKDPLYYIIEDGHLILNPHYEEDKAQQEKQEQIEQLKRQLDTIDAKKIRSTSAIALGIATQDDIDYLTHLEEQAEDIRQQIRELQGE